MKTTFKMVEVINIIALLFLIFGAYGLAITGALQVIAAIFFFLLFPKNKLIYIYFGSVITFFLIWDKQNFDWILLFPVSLIFFLTYIIYNQKANQ